MSVYQKYCVYCGKTLEATSAKSKYCSRACEAKRYRESKGLHKLKDGRFCRQCGTHFQPVGTGGNNKQHCSDECSLKSARESRSKFYKNNPDKVAENKRRTVQKLGDGNMKRFLRRFPDAPTSCQSCGENRVLDIAHKPEHKRNGAWRSVKNTTLEKVWILCPTCHALLDRMNYSPDVLGLP